MKKEKVDLRPYLHTPEVRAKATRTLKKTLAAKKLQGMNIDVHGKQGKSNGQIPDATIDTLYGSVLILLRPVAAHTGIPLEDLARRLSERLSDPGGQ